MYGMVVNFHGDQIFFGFLSMIIYVHSIEGTVVQKFFDNISLIKIQGKIFSWMHDFLEIFLP